MGEEEVEEEGKREGKEEGKEEEELQHLVRMLSSIPRLLASRLICLLPSRLYRVPFT